MKNNLKFVLGSLAVTLLICAVCVTPLFRYGSTGIASSFRPVPGGPIQMEPGDHIQLMYHFWLLADSIWGETPLFRNPYEFNKGKAYEDPRLHGLYYAPFGPMFALMYPILGHAASWNLTCFISVWLGYLATVLLLRRYFRSFLLPFLGALPALLITYRWATLLGGSPTGFAMLWPPVMMLGIDIAVRDRRLSGAWLAGAALLLAKWGDTHVFFFGFLAIPFWCLVSFLKSWNEHERADGNGFSLSRSIRQLYSLWPLALCMVIAMMMGMFVARSIEGSIMDTGRDFGEILLFTPTHRGLLGRPPAGEHDLQIYLGYVMPLAIIAGFLVMTADLLRRRRNSGYKWFLFFSLLAATVAIVWLALGPRMPLDPHIIVFRAARRLFPPYRMIRQTAKIYAILPPMLSLLFGLALSRFAAWPVKRQLKGLLIGGIVAATIFDYGRRIDPAICLLEYEQKAYSAVVDDSAALNRELRAMALPLWPGDSHWGALYEYYSSLYRIRMVNGYSPVVDRDYILEIFEPFYPFNIGYMEDERLDDLIDRGIGYLILHEDAFPYKVSPFPVIHTLSALKQHPRLSLLTRDRAVWAFRIEEQALKADTGNGLPAISTPPATDYSTANGSGRTDSLAPTDFYFPARLWFAAFAPPEGSSVITNQPDANMDSYLRVCPASDAFTTSPQPIYSRPGLRYFARIRGHGAFFATVQAHAPDGTPDDSGPTTVESFSFDTTPDEWEWIEVPVREFSGYQLLSLKLGAETGELDIDTILLGAGHWPMLKPGEAVTLPAASFFRAGHSIPETGQVVLEHKRIRQVPFYGPDHALPAGIYEMELFFESPAPDGTELGRIRTGFPFEADILDVPIIAGEKCSFKYIHEHNLLFGLQIHVTRKADMIVNALRIERRE